MIEFKILGSVDKSQQALYQHEGAELSFGSAKADMIIDDPQFAETQFRFFHDGQSFKVENFSEELELRINGKPVSPGQEIHPKDNLNIGRLTMQILRADLEAPKAPEPYVYPNYEGKFPADSKERAVLKVLEHLKTQQSLHAAPPGSPVPPPPMAGKSASPPMPGSTQAPPPNPVLAPPATPPKTMPATPSPPTPVAAPPNPKIPLPPGTPKR